MRIFFAPLSKGAKCNVNQQVFEHIATLQLEWPNSDFT
jgi:hypothetical protein